MSPRKSDFRSKKYPNLVKYPERSPFWVFKKYSSIKGREFSHSTKESDNESKAYKIGLDAFNDWLGRAAVSGQVPSFAEFAATVLRQKQRLPEERLSAGTKETSRHNFNALIRVFGKLRIDQLTAARWDDFCARSLSEKPQKFFSRRKALIEIMRRAHREGLIKELPKYENPDPAPEEGEFLEDEWVLRIIDQASSPERVLFYNILWRMGPRPGEVLQYRWDMIRWNEGDHGFIHIPAAITKTRRKRSIPLNEHVSELLKKHQAEQGCESPFVFPGYTGNGRRPDVHQVEYRTSWEACRARAATQLEAEIEKLKAGKAKGSDEKIAHLREGLRKIRAVSIYALRGTFITNCLDRGISSTLIGKYVDNSGPIIDRLYARRKGSAMQGIAAVGGAT